MFLNNYSVMLPSSTAGSSATSSTSNINSNELGVIGRGVRPLPVPPSDKPLTRAKLDAQQLTASETFSRFEKGLRFDYDCDQKKWISTEVTVRLALGAFDRGYQRICFRMSEWNTNDANPAGEGEAMVAKFLDKGVLEPLVGPLMKEMYFNDVKCQSEAVKYCNLFNERTPPQPIWFAPGHVVQFLERPGKPFSACEPMMEGHFVKHNNNNGAVLSQRQTPQAYSHFTYEQSGGKLVICDIQGVDNSFTDPQVHSESGTGYGLGNQGVDGIRKFLKSHTCNGVCLAIGLPRLVNGKKVTDWTKEQREAVIATVRGQQSCPSEQNEQLAKIAGELEKKKDDSEEDGPLCPLQVQELEPLEVVPPPPQVRPQEQKPSEIEEVDSAASLSVGGNTSASSSLRGSVRSVESTSNNNAVSSSNSSSNSNSGDIFSLEDKENVNVEGWQAKAGFSISPEGLALLQRIDRLERMAASFMITNGSAEGQDFSSVTTASSSVSSSTATTASEAVTVSVAETKTVKSPQKPNKKATLSPQKQQPQKGQHQAQQQQRAQVAGITPSRMTLC